MKTIGIIGAGPAGMTAALHAAQADTHVLLFDGNPAVGRKLLVTGSGRCNLTNAGVRAGRYACGSPDALARLLKRFGRPELLAFLNSIGVLAQPTDDGWYYPLSESAATVVDAFAAALAVRGVELRLGSRVTVLGGEAGNFHITLDGGQVERVDRLVAAFGGKAYPNLGARGELFATLERMGHTVLPLRPALAPVVCEMRPYQKLQGVRLDVTARLWENERLLGETSGNLIFTQWGLNGPAVMDLSHLVSARPDRPLRLTLNLLAGHEAEFRRLFEQNRASEAPLRVLLGAALPPKLAAWVVENAGLNADAPVREVSKNSLARTWQQITALPLEVKGTRDFEFCQVAAGGVPLDEVTPETMESTRRAGLYLAGEVLDVVGPCGGYNLQFAFSSGAVAGMNAAGKQES